jgi:hypothetical protein
MLSNFKTLAHEGDEVISLTHRPPLPPGMFLVLIFTMGFVDPRTMVRSAGNMSLKNPVTPPGIDPGTVRLVTERLNHYASPGPYVIYVRYINVDKREAPKSLKRNQWVPIFRNIPNFSTCSDESA